MLNKLIEIIDDVQHAAQQVVSGSEELSSGAEQISESSAQQAASVEEISATVEEMNSTIALNAENAQKTAGIAGIAADSAIRGEKTIRDMVKAMNAISGKIVVIEEIVRETNMLAINAAIEASKAGEYGKGFAIVSSEIRKLSDRSQKAAREISRLSTVNSEKAEKAGKQLEEMVTGIQKTSDLIQEISAASNEQALGISQVNEAVQQLDLALQQNVSISEELSSCSTAFFSQAESLLNLSSYFRLPEKTAEEEDGDSDFNELFENFIKKEKKRLYQQFRKNNRTVNTNAALDLISPDKETQHEGESDDQDFEKY